MHTFKSPLEALRHHVSGAIARGEAVAVKEMPAPAIGQLVMVRGVEARIIKIRPMGTIDVEATDGSGRCWRLSGLAF